MMFWDLMNENISQAVLLRLFQEFEPWPTTTTLHIQLRCMNQKTQYISRNYVRFQFAFVFALYYGNLLYHSKTENSVSIFSIESYLRHTQLKCLLLQLAMMERLQLRKMINFFRRCSHHKLYNSRMEKFIL